MNDVIVFFDVYPYLGGSFFLLVLAFLSLFFGAGHRHLILLSGLLSAPCGFLSVIFVPDYWNPVRVATFLAGPEDVIFSFANGCTVWLMAVWFVREQLTVVIHPSRILLRFAACVFVGWLFSFPFWMSGFGVMASVLIGCISLGFGLVWYRRSFWIIAASGAVSFGLLYTVLILLFFSFWPQFLAQWNFANLWGVSVFGAPLEEVLWALVFGGVWPLIVAYSLDVRLRGIATAAARYGETASASPRVVRVR